jgi:hypothetical protein
MVPTTLEEAARATDAAIARWPGLTGYGIAKSDMSESLDQKALRSERCLKNVCICADWFRIQLSHPHKYWRTKSVTRRLTSWTFKTGIEGHASRYVSNASVIIAASLLGLKVTEPPDSSNPWISLGGMAQHDGQTAA